MAGSEYFEDFETNEGGWIAEAFDATNSTAANLIKSDTSWIWGPLTGATIDHDTLGVNAWWTGKNSNSYFSNENSAVNGPCFNLSQLKRPMVSLDYFSDAETNLDGAVLQYSTDGGFTWAIVGPPAGQPDRDEGINWYNGSGIFSNPGSQPIGNYGWTNKQGKWKNARFNMDIIPSAKRGQVRLRMAFSSNDGNNPDFTFDGFAFDNFFVGEKKRNVLVEHFTTSALTASTSADTYLNNLLADQITIDHPVSDFYNIQYHINFSGTGIDYLNRDNPTDPAARALYYGVSQPPYTVMDGLLKPGKFTGDYKEINQVEITRRSLEDPQFELVLDTFPTNTSRTISVQLKLTAAKATSLPLIAHVALIEDDVTVPNVGVFKNVLRQQLFGSDGETINLSFAPGVERAIPPKLNVDIKTAITNPSKLYLVGYVMDKNTKEIYQSIVIKAPPKAGSPIVGVKDNDPIIMANLNAIQLFPNPAKESFNFGIPGEIQSDTQWEIIDQRGITVLKGDFSKTMNGLLSVEVSSIPNALYYVVITGQHGAIVRKKLIVMNRN